ncbi:hypothetical protein [Nocardia brasiliensis]|uniref:hypothetical protein n=1 Tax=Nocardia brasiliensis TaxID=37326 RepID=UPI0024588AA6|nr:hypothetical protein [Nocardia brasiliensis]
MSSDGVAAAEVLRELLLSRPEYKRRWMAHVRRLRTNEVSYAAVSQVVALYLWDQGIVSDSDTDLPRRLRDRIRHALRGEQLSYETLNWLIEAFSFSVADAHAIWDAYAGVSVSNFHNEGISYTLKTPPVPMVSPQRHQTKAMFSRYFLNANRMLERIETCHALVALEDGVDTFGYSPRDTLVDVQVIAGGTFAGFRESTPGFVGVEIRLDRVLRLGQHASLQYFTTHRETPRPCTQLRRASRNRLNDFDVRIIFQEALPKRAWWCAWDSYDGGNSVLKTPVELTPSRELHQFLPYVEHTVVGFEWEW